jgi:signal peptidase II
MKIIPALLFIFIVFADQLVKAFISKTIGAQSISILPEILKLKIHQNTGIAFGLPFNPWLAYFLIIFLAILIFIIRKRKQNLHRFCFASYPFILIFSGALSNLLDRVRFGYVIDYVEFIPLRGFFNLADCAIIIGILMIILRILKNQNNVNQKRQSKDC